MNLGNHPNFPPQSIPVVLLSTPSVLPSIPTVPPSIPTVPPSIPTVPPSILTILLSIPTVPPITLTVLPRHMHVTVRLWHAKLRPLASRRGTRFDQNFSFFTYSKKNHAPQKVSFYIFSPEKWTQLVSVKEVLKAGSSSIKALTFDNLFPPQRHSCLNSHYPPYHIFLPKWCWFTRVHYLVLENLVLVVVLVLESKGLYCPANGIPT